MSYELNETLQSLLIDQQIAEFKSSYRYLDIAFYFNDKYLPGCTSFFKHHYEEELGHYKKIVDYLMVRQVFSLRRNFTFTLNNPPFDYSVKENISDILKNSVKAEINTTDKIKEIMQIAREYKDYHLENFIMWFIKEQLEEEFLFEEINTTWENMKDSNLALREFDEYLSEKTNKIINVKK